MDDASKQEQSETQPCAAAAGSAAMPEATSLGDRVREVREHLERASAALAALAALAELLPARTERVEEAEDPTSDRRPR